MAIVKKPQLQTAQAPSLDKFIQAAPDGDQKASGKEEEGVQITLRLDKMQLERLTKMAKRQGIPRASYIKRAVFIQLETDEAKLV